MTIESTTPPVERPPITANDILEVALLIAEHSRGQNGLGRVPCPVCKRGTIGYSVARGRGRRGLSVACRCSTDGCVAFMS